MPLTDIKVSYTLEQWRKSNATVAQTVTFWCKIDSVPITSLSPNTNSGWIQVVALAATSPINTGAPAGALDGNLSVNQSY